MFTIQELNLVCGVGWDEQYDDKLFLCFHEQEGGISEEVTISCKAWSHRMHLTTPFRTAHLPSTMIFKMTDLRTLFRKIKAGYKNFAVVLPLEFSEFGFEVKNGPARGTKILAIKR